MAEPRVEKPMLVVVRALAVLTALSNRPEGATLQQLHRELEIPLGSMHRLATTLEGEGFVLRSPATKRYTLGEAARALGYQEQGEMLLVSPPPEILAIARESGETVFLTRMIDSRVVCIALVESVHPLRLFVRVGQEMPLHAAASARIVLAHRDPALVEAILTSRNREAFTSGTMREVNQLIDHLGQARRYGFDVCSSELDAGVWAVAAPVFDSTGKVGHGVALAAAGGRVITPQRRAEYTALVIRAAEELSRKHGYTGPIPGPHSLTDLTELYEKAGEEHPFLALSSERSAL